MKTLFVGDIEDLLIYLRDHFNCNMKLYKDKVFIDSPEQFKPRLIENKDEVKKVLLNWKKTYLDHLKDIQIRMNDDYEAKLSGISDVWDDSADGLTKNFLYIEKVLHQRFDYGSSCINGSKTCRNMVISCHFCTSKDLKELGELNEQ